MLTHQYIGHGVTFSVFETVSSVSGIKTMPRNQNTVLFEPIHFADSSESSCFTTVIGWIFKIGRNFACRIFFLTPDSKHLEPGLPEGIFSNQKSKLG
jgi:hypothetical protein